MVSETVAQIHSFHTHQPHDLFRYAQQAEKSRSPLLAKGRRWDNLDDGLS